MIQITFPCNLCNQLNQSNQVNQRFRTTSPSTIFASQITKKMINTELSVKMVMDRWNGSITQLDKLLTELSDEQLNNQIAPGKNSGTYLLGHLIAANDDIIRLFGLGDKLYPELLEPFIRQPYNTDAQTHTPAELKEMLHELNHHLQERFDQMTPEQWFEKHTAVTEEDFAKEPFRNKLNIIITRTSHLQYHLGQIALLK